jgi:tetratricopeptide (TPR) repeat protein
MPTDWYRNETWDESIERVFDEKLKRARSSSRDQYLRVQANALVRARPDVALQLLERYFALGVTTFDAEACEIRGRALLALGRVDEAIEAYEATLKREEEFPNVKTNCRLDLPLLIASRRIESRYQQALDLAREAEQDESLMSFPAARFQCHAAKALIAADSGRLAEARADAALAIEAAEHQHSGYRYHPDVGLVAGQHAEILADLKRIIA